MDTTLSAISTELTNLVSVLNTAIPDARSISIAHNNWQFPSVSRDDLIRQVLLSKKRIDSTTPELSAEQKAIVASFPEKLTFLRVHTVPNIWGNSQVAVPAFMASIRALEAALDAVLPTTPSKEELAQAVLDLKTVRQRLNTLTLALAELEPKKTRLSEMVARIEQAHATADQLPADLEDLAHKRAVMDELLEFADNDKAKIEALVKRSEESVAVNTVAQEATKVVLENAEKMLKRCETAYSASTSVGLAAAFSERSSSLAFSMWAWVVGLAAALVAGGYFGTEKLKLISELFKTSAVSIEGIALNVVLALISVGGPVWFSWVATRQIGQRFKLSEDYAFKATISRAYEGYRKEASNIDKTLEARLLASALDRLDEQPLRFVEVANHGSPLQELFSSDVVRKAAKTVPDFASKVQTFASDALSTFKSGQSAVASATTPAEKSP